MAALPPPAVEFEAWRLPERRALATPAILSMMLLFAAFSVADVRDLVEGLPRTGLLLARLATLIVGLSVISLIRRTDRAKVVDWSLFAFCALVVGILTVRHLTVPVLSPTHHISDAVIVIYAYFLPIPLALQLSLAVTLTISGLATVTPELSLFSVAMSHALAQAIGLVMSFHVRRTARLRYEAFTEIRTLRGIIPICASCKQIRDDEGFWHQVERYVSDRSEADFTHGYCPSCLEDFFSEMEEDRTAQTSKRTGGAERAP